MPAAPPPPGPPSDATPDPTAPSPAEDAFAAALHTVVVRLRRLGEHGAGLDLLPMSEVEVLSWVAAHPGTTVTRTARALGLQHSNVSATVARLVRRELLERRPDPDDARRALLHPTDRARADRARIDAAWARDVRSLLAGLAPDERAALLASAAALDRIAQEWSDARLRDAPPDPDR